MVEQQREEAHRLHQKYHRCQSLRAKLDEEGYQLQREYLALMKEKVIYATQMASIDQLGNNLAWEPQLLARIRPFIEAAKARLTDSKNKPAPT